MSVISAIVHAYFAYVRKRPKLTKRALFYIHDGKTFYAAARNEINYLLRRDRGYKVSCVVVELSSRCNLNCTICARHDVMNRTQGDMQMDTVKTIVEMNPDVGMYILVGWGEMMLNKGFFDAVEYLRQRDKRIAFTSNATLFTEENVERLIRSGISNITVSMDGIDEVYESIRGVSFMKIEENLVRLSRRIRETGSGIYLDVNSVGREDVLKKAPEMYRRIGPYVDDIRFSSYLEYNKLLKTNRVKPCREFWRGMITVLFDGKVVPCCMDYNASMVIGHVEEDTLQDIWNGERMRRLRREHLNLEFKRRCATCYEEEPSRNGIIEKRFD